MPQKPYRTDFSVQPDAKVACWYGEKEGHMKKAIQRLRTAGQKKIRGRIRKGKEEMLNELWRKIDGYRN